MSSSPRRPAPPTTRTGANHNLNPNPNPNPGPNPNPDPTPDDRSSRASSGQSPGSSPGSERVRGVASFGRGLRGAAALGSPTLDTLDSARPRKTRSPSLVPERNGSSPASSSGRVSVRRSSRSNISQRNSAALAARAIDHPRIPSLTSYDGIKWSQAAHCTSLERLSSRLSVTPTLTRSLTQTLT